MTTAVTKARKPEAARQKASRRHVYEDIKRAAIDGTISFDQRLSEDCLAKMFGVSRTPIREAVFRLLQEGLVTKKDNSYFCVRRPSEEELEDLFEVRLLLNNLLIDKLMENWDDRLAEDLKKNVEDTKVFLENGDDFNLNYALSEFHTIMYLGAKSPTLAKILSGMVDQVLLGRAMALKYPGVRKMLVTDHEKVLEALFNKDRATCKKRMAVHLQNTKKKALEVLLRDRLREIAEDSTSGRPSQP